MGNTSGTRQRDDLKAAERAVDRAFSTGKVDRATITRQAQLDAAEAVAMAGVAMESDEAADEAAKLAVITAGMGNREKTKEARERERMARNQAKADHRAATKSAKQAYDAIKFSDPSKLGFMRLVQVVFLMHIVGTIATLIFTSRDTVVYNSVSLADWFMVVLEGVAFYFFVNRMKLGRPLVMGMAVIGIVVNVADSVMAGTFSILGTVLGNMYYLFLLIYFAFSDRVKSVLVNDMSTEHGIGKQDDFVIVRSGWPFYRNLGIYFVIFSVLGHWMEAAMCQLIRLGLVQGEYDPSNTMLWRDWLYPYPMEGAAVVLIALLLYPLYLWLKKRFSNQIVAHAISFVANAFTCTVIEFIGGILFNAQHQNWDYSDMPFNFMGQVCLQNALAFGVAASLIAWYAYPALERAIARVRPGIMNIVFVVVIAIGGILFSLYAIAPPEGMDLGAVKQELADMGETQQQSGGVLSTIELADSFTSTTQDVLTDATSVDEATRNEAQEHLSKAREELAKAKELLQDVA
jgi:uncharacterized membrane protein